ncbi:MAG: NUDIX domain-containing protein [Chitinophagaceae bacterium]|nr:MAG: NUDIX domain-containing protein [Chitinophagaceae bacterium]
MSNVHFIIRVYGIFIKEGNLLTVAENYNNQALVKFPGGGLQFGEGIKDCLKREWKEETGYEVDKAEHFYTNDFFQASAFHKNSQVISMYYLVECNGLNFNSIPNEKKITYNWQSLDSLDLNQFTLPIDRKVAELLYKTYSTDSANNKI